MKRQLITVGEAAKRAGCSRQAIHAAIKARRIEAESEEVTRYVWMVDAKSLATFTPNPNMQRSGRPKRIG